MGLNLAALRNELRASLGVDADDLPDTSLTRTSTDELLNRSLWEVTEKFAFREKEYSTNFVASSAYGNKYTLPGNFEALLNVSVQNPDNQRQYDLVRMTRVTYDAEFNSNVSDQCANGQPTGYLRDNDCIIFWPAPDKAYNIKLRYLLTISDLTDANPNLTIPQSWHEIILLGAVWRGFITFGDYDRSERAKQHQLSLIVSSVPVEAKEEFDSHISGVEVMGRVSSSRRL